METKHSRHGLVQLPLEMRADGKFAEAILNSVDAHIAVIDGDGVIIAVNDAWRRFAVENSTDGDKMPHCTEVGANYLEVCRNAESDRNGSARAAMDGIQAVMAGRSDTFSLECPCHAPGKERWFMMTATPLGRQSRRGTVVVHSEITERVAAEQKLLESERRMATELADMKRFHELSVRPVEGDDLQPRLHDVVELAISMTQADMGTIVTADRETGELRPIAQIGFTPSPATEALRIDPHRVDSTASQAVLHKKQIVVGDVVAIPIFADNSLRDFLLERGVRALVATPMISREGRVLGVFTTHYRRPTVPDAWSLSRIELLARHAATLIERSDWEVALRQSEQRFSQFMEHTPGLAFIKDHEGRFIEANEATARSLGKTRAELRGRLDQDLVEPDRAARFHKTDRIVVDNGQEPQFIETFERPDGTRQHFLINKFPIPGPNGEPPRIGGIGVDVTERIEADEAIRQIAAATSPTTGEEFFRTLVVHLTQACYVDYAFISQYESASPKRASTLAMARRGELVDNISYELHNTPCSKVIDNRLWFYPTAVQREFPHARLLAQMNIDSYLGIGLCSGAGEMLGLLAILHDRPLANPERAKAILQIAAARAAGELERERAQAALRASEARLRTFLDHAADVLLLHDEKSRIVDVNRQACVSLGYTRDEMIGMLPSAFDPDANDRRSESFHKQLAAGETVAFDSRHRRKDGSVFPVEVRIRPFWVDGQRFGLSLARDITERQQAERARIESERRLTMILEHADVGLWDWDLAANAAVFSREWRRQLGYEEHEIANRIEEWESRVHADDLQQVLDRVNALIERGEGEYAAEFRMRHKDGTWRWIMARGSLVQNSAGEPTRLVGVHLDVTERKWAEAALRRQLRVLERIATGDPLSDVLEEIVDLVEGQIADSLCSILLLDERGTRLRFGAGRQVPAEYSRSIDGISIGPRVGSCGTAAYLKKTVIVSDIAVDPLWADYRELGLKFGLKSCWSIPIFVGGAAGDGSDGGVVLGTFALYRHEPSAPTEEDIRVVSAAAQLAGIAVERHRAEATIHESEERLRTLLEDLHNVAVKAYDANGKITFWNKASERLYGYSKLEALGHDWIESLQSEQRKSSERKILAEALRTGKSPEPEEIEVLRRDGDKITVLSNRILHRRPGRPPEFFRFDVDVTNRRRAEEELAIRQTELIHASRLTTLGQMVAALSHEVAQPLTAIGNYATASDQLLDDPTPAASEKLREYIQAIFQQNRRCTAILQRLRDFSRRTQPTRSSCDIRQLLSDSVELVANELRRQEVKVHQQIAEPLPLIIADRIQLQQVIVNLLNNACDAVRKQSADRRLVTIRASADEQSIELAVEDLGAGFSAETAQRLFEPFFTTKQEGMGIGLNICESIVRDHGGRIDASINSRGGATFRIRLPLLQSA